MAPTVYFATSSLAEVSAVRSVLDTCFDVVCLSVEIDKIQGNPEAVCTAKCKAAGAWLYNGSPFQFIVEDSSLLCERLFGLPGAYLEQFMNTLGSQGVVSMLTQLDATNVVAQSIIALSTPRKFQSPEIRLFIGKCEGILVMPRSADGFDGPDFDKIFQPTEQEDPDFPLTLAQMDKEQRMKVSHYGKAADMLKTALDQGCS
jgi:non-canonical purine NTP pyrophosphatase (RdgB/HAM1 family)